MMRKATSADKEAVVALCRAIDPHDYLPEIYDWGVEAGNLYVYEQDGRIVGCHAREWTAPGCVFFYAMRIDPTVQGRGIGSAYAAAQVEEAVAEGARHIFLSSAPGNVRAHRTVEKHGFVNEGDWFIYDEVPLPAVALPPGRARAGRPEDLPAVLAFQAGLTGQVLADVYANGDFPYSFAMLRDDAWVPERLAVVPGSAGLEGVMLLGEIEKGQLYIHRLEGTPAAAAELLGYALAWAKEKGLTQLCISLPARCEALLAPLGLDPQKCERWFIFHYRAE